MTRKIYLRILSTAIILLSAGAGIFLADHAKVFTIEKVVLNAHITGNEALAKYQSEELQKILQPFEGEKLWKISSSDVFAAVQSLPWVEQVEVSKILPATLQISVKAKQVYAILIGHKGQLLPIGQTGEILPAIESTDLPDVAVLRGEKFRNEQDLRRDAVELISSLPEEGKFSTKTLLEMSYDEKHGFVALLSGSGSPVWLGSENLPAKAVRVSRVLEYLNNNSLETRVIDATYDKKVLVRLRKDP